MSEKEKDDTETNQGNVDEHDEDLDLTSTKSKRSVRGARKRKQGFQQKIEQERSPTNTKQDVVEKRKNNTASKDTKRKRGTKTREKSTAGAPKKKRCTDDFEQRAVDIHCFMCEDDSVVYRTEDDFFDHCAEEHLNQNEQGKMQLPCCKCEKSFRVSASKGTRNSLRTPVFILLNHLVEKHGEMRPDWAPVYK